MTHGLVMVTVTLTVIVTVTITVTDGTESGRDSDTVTGEKKVRNLK